MRINKIYWKTSSDDNARSILLALNDNYLDVILAERKNNRIRTIKRFTDGLSYTCYVGVKKQCEFITNNPLSSMYQFYIIESV